MKWRDLAEWARAAAGPLPFAREMLGFFPDEGQARVLGEAPKYRRIGLNCSRQWGKSTVMAVLAVYRMVMEPGATVLVAGPSARQSWETVNKVRGFLRVLGVKGRVNQDELVLPNGSRIVALPAVEATIRGFSAVSMLIIDEAARVPDEICLALLPSLAVSGGDLIVASTPRGRRGFFYRVMVEEEGPEWLKHTGPVTECKRIPESFLRQERARGEEYYAQEYLGQYVESGRYVFDEAQVRGMENAEETAWRVI